MENNKQSSLEWFAQQIDNLQYNPLEKNGYANAKKLLLDQAKAMHKEEIIDSHIKGNDTYTVGGDYYDVAKQYYEQTFGGKDGQQ